MIRLRFESVDGGKWNKACKTLQAARDAIHYQLGGCEMGSHYVISGDGICKCIVHGGPHTLREIMNLAPSGKVPHDERARLIEEIVRNEYLDEDTDAADLALDELARDDTRTDNEIAKVVSMRIAQP